MLSFIFDRHKTASGRQQLLRRQLDKSDSCHLSLLQKFVEQTIKDLCRLPENKRYPYLLKAQDTLIEQATKANNRKSKSKEYDYYSDSYIIDGLIDLTGDANVLFSLTGPERIKALENVWNAVVDLDLIRLQKLTQNLWHEHIINSLPRQDYRRYMNDVLRDVIRLEPESLNDLVCHQDILGGFDHHDACTFIETAQAALIDKVRTAEANTWEQEQAIDRLRDMMFHPHINDVMDSSKSSQFLLAGLQAFKHCISAGGNSTYRGIESLVQLLCNLPMTSIPQKNILLRENIAFLSNLDTSMDGGHLSAFVAEQMHNLICAPDIIEIIPEDERRTYIQDVLYVMSEQKVDFLRFGNSANKPNSLLQTISSEAITPYVEENILLENGLLKVHGKTGESLQLQLKVIDAFLSNKDEFVQANYLGILYDFSTNMLNQNNAHSNTGIFFDYAHINALLTKYQYEAQPVNA